MVVRYASVPGNAPASLVGRFIFSPAAANQAAPSPFTDGSNYVCYKELTANKSADGNATYTFDALTVPATAPFGKYELTFVLKDNTTMPKTQWSQDPEFDIDSGG